MACEYIVVAIVALIVSLIVSWLIGRKTNQKIDKTDRKIDKILDMMVTMKKGDTVEASTASLVAHPVAVRTEVVTATISHLPISKAAAQKRLDEDTKRVGFVRGEVYELEDGSWGIHWGGKYPLASQ